MMSADLSLLAARYATAALNSWGAPLSLTLCDRVQKIILFYRTNHSLFFFLQVPLFSHDNKKIALSHVRVHYGLPDYFDELSTLLLTHKRIFLLLMVYEQLIKQSYSSMNKVPCIVTTSVPLSHMQQQVCMAFVQKIGIDAPLITWSVDASLIAGIRVQTDATLWEWSLDARLRDLANTVLM